MVLGVSSLADKLTRLWRESRIITFRRKDGTIVKSWPKTLNEVYEDNMVGIFDPVPITVVDMGGRKVPPKETELDYWRRIFKAQYDSICYKRTYLICG